ncbi:hypothetical protein Gotur_023183, partial [Gossypium turneri]
WLAHYLIEFSEIWPIKWTVNAPFLITHGLIFANKPYMIVVDVITYGYRDIVMAPYGNCWRQVRKICTVELLTAKRVQSFESIRQEEVSD